MTTAMGLIVESVEHDRIVTADRTDVIAEEFEIICDDCVLNGDVEEFWGETPDGDEWRVHLRVRPKHGADE